MAMLQSVSKGLLWTDIVAAVVGFIMLCVVIYMCCMGDKEKHKNIMCGLAVGSAVLLGGSLVVGTISAYNVSQAGN